VVDLPSIKRAAATATQSAGADEAARGAAGAATHSQTATRANLRPSGVTI
jgi:hypothetical protein